MNILIADDVAMNRKLLRTVLEAEGMTVLEAADGLAALEALERYPVDAIISDILMPGLDGYRLCHEVRGSQKSRDLPIIIYTATYLSPADQKLALDMGADRFITKPAPVRVILDALREATCARIRPVGSISLPQELGLMKEYSERLVAKLGEQNIELQERVQFASLAVEVGIALSGIGTVRQGLQRSTETLVRYLDLAFARIWTLNEKTNELELEASAGIYTHIDGAHGRVPVGRFKIGRIAQRGTPHLSKDVPNDPEVGDPEWAKREGMVAFAGYPLSVEGRVVGVVAAFGRKLFPDTLIQTFASVSIQLGQFITRKRAEDQVLAAKEAAEASARSTRQVLERLDLALKASGTGIWTSDEVSNIVVWDEKTHELWGVRPGDFGGTWEDFAAHIHQDDRAATLLQIQQCTPQKPVFVVDFRVVWPDGSVHQLDGRGQAFYNEAGLLVRRTGVSHDITEKRHLEEQFRQGQKMEAVGQLAGGIAHDFNNMLNVIIGYSQLLLASSTPHDPAYRRIEEIRKAAERAAGLTQQLLAFSRKQVLQPRVLNLADIVADMDDMVRRVIGANVEIATKVGENLTQVKIDPSQAQQVILNLVVNARDAMPEGGKLTLEVMNAEMDEGLGRLHAIPPGKYVMLAVSDNGSGMSPEVQKRVFEPFFTTKEVGQGTGLGLATVHGIVKQSGGHVWLYSEPEFGTTFKIFFPSIDEPQELSIDEPVQNTARGEGTILVIEDEPGLRALVQEVLSSAGYEVLVAEEGHQALRISEQHIGQIRLLLTDVVVPKMGGKEIASRLTALRPEMQVLFMSGYTENAVARNGRWGAEGQFIQKPWTPEGLCAKIHAVLTSPASIQRILVVDDEPAICNWLAETLEKAGYQVFTARDGQQARAQANEHPIDMVISDLAMPREEGLETIRAIRKEHPQLKIIAMSGAFGPDVLNMARVFGAQATLMKPLTGPMVLQCIREVAGGEPGGRTPRADCQAAL